METKGLTGVEMEVGGRGHAECTVQKSQLASQMKSGDLDVFATPAMVALMESTLR